jgi:hypothetical protein
VRLSVLTHAYLRFAIPSAPWARVVKKGGDMKRNPDAIPQNESEAQSREQALAVVALMRREGLSLREAATRAGIDPRTVLRYVGSALERQGQHGEYRATPHDQSPRSLHFITPQGTVVITVKDSRTASRIAEHMNAVRAFTNSGDLAPLDAFKEETFEVDGVTYMFVTDPATLETLADAGVLSIDRLYKSVLG